MTSIKERALLSSFSFFLYGPRRDLTFLSRWSRGRPKCMRQEATTQQRRFNSEGEDRLEKHWKEGRATDSREMWRKNHAGEEHKKTGGGRESWKLRNDTTFQKTWTNLTN